MNNVNNSDSDVVFVPTGIRVVPRHDEVLFISPLPSVKRYTVSYMIAVLLKVVFRKVVRQVVKDSDTDMIAWLTLLEFPFMMNKNTRGGVAGFLAANA